MLDLLHNLHSDAPRRFLCSFFASVALVAEPRPSVALVAFFFFFCVVRLWSRGVLQHRCCFFARANGMRTAAPQKQSKNKARNMITL